MNTNNQSIFNKKILLPAVVESLFKCNPYKMYKNPVMFCVLLVTILCTLILFNNILHNVATTFDSACVIWLWFTILFANFSESIAEGKSKAQAETLKSTKQELIAHKIINETTLETRTVNAEELKVGDLIFVKKGDLIACDGDVVEGCASIDESTITGESEPVIKSSGSDNCAVTAGTLVLSDEIIVKITKNPGENFIDKMIALVEGSSRLKSPNEISLNILLSGLTLIFIVAIIAIFGMSRYYNSSLSIIMLVALFVTLIPTTIAGLLSAIGISGMDRLLKHNVIALSGKAIEAAGSADILLLDKTGTITIGNRYATQFIPLKNSSIDELVQASYLCSFKDETSEGKSIVSLAQNNFSITDEIIPSDKMSFIEFSAFTRMSGIDYLDQKLRKGAVNAIIEEHKKNNNDFDETELQSIVENIASDGGTPLAVMKNNNILGVIVLKDQIKPGIKEKFLTLKKMGIKTVMVTGDNPLTAAAIAKEAGVDDFVAQASPEDKLNYIKEVQKEGKVVAMCGDGTNDAPALAQADIGVAMASGTSAAREAGNMLDLDSDPSKLIKIIEIGKQILITRGALTTFSIANDVAKYFAIIPALFILSLPALKELNIMHLSSPNSAILSAVIFNALIIIALIPLALVGVKSSTLNPQKLLKNNLIKYGFGGILVPFIAIKIIDIFLTSINFL